MKDSKAIELFIETVYNKIIGIEPGLEEIKMPTSEIKNIKNIIEKYPNLKRISINRTPITKRDVGEDFSNILELVKYMKCVEIVPYLSFEEVKREIEKSQNLFLSNDGICIVNSENLDMKAPVTSLKINLEDLEKVGIERLIKTRTDIIIVINSVAELSIEELDELQKRGLKISRIKIFDETNGIYQNRPYDIQSYCYVRKTLEDLVEGIDINAPEKERFAEVYRRICEKIEYDHKVGYPKDESDEEYSNNESCNSRNLINGLLKGKCVCCGYADILRNALSLVNIEAKYISGANPYKKISEDKFDSKKLKYGYVYEKKDGKVVIAEDHAWNKVKLDGVWYNVDVTWDAQLIKRGFLPQCCLKTDEEIKKIDKKADFKGPACVTKISQTEVDKLFDKKHIYIGNLRIPTLADIMTDINEVAKVYRKIGHRLERGIKKVVKINSAKTEPAVRNVESQNTGNNSWNLENWGIDSKTFEIHLPNENETLERPEGENIKKRDNREI